jgi:hypothetical protein
MDAERIIFESVEAATRAIDGIGSNNSRMMATRAIHVNVMLRRVPGPLAKTLKTAYNDIGAEAAISSSAYYEEQGAVTDMVVMGTVYQHREVRRVLVDNATVRPWIEAIETVVENAPEAQGS